MNIIIAELALLITIIIFSTYAILREDKIIESKLDYNSEVLRILLDFIKGSFDKIICKSNNNHQSPSRKDTPNADDWRKP
ncbi:hypothetical protein [Limnospira fusiformis]|uniref:hypothetical protein n=1 Tax=Limnospira fusiformis TaxID=54297 RepID=UPI0034E09988